eukprot:TRINITY_DN1697_c0_g2_i1.p1 TRINITY_DN1697_c0_g2~~TRINITY_DN1697_c0_g2_i1.p1  ORF type:complete len:375 (+),score=89.53 TRINITY_DN1697_c0_g2_i1:61-1185(+)
MGAFGMIRPAWTIAFAIIWVIIVIGAIIMHSALASLVPALQGLPAGLDEGFNVVFGFDQLVTQSENMKTSSTNAIEKCEADAETYCNAQRECNGIGANRVQKDMNTEKDEIVAAFDKGLEKIIKIGTDKYFGMDSFQDAASKLTDIRDELDSLDANGPCCATTKLFCEMRKNSDELSKMGTEIRNMIATFTQNDGVVMFEAQTGNLMALHALPYVLVLSTVFFAVLWYKNGACCCCSNGSCIQVVCLILPQVVFWLVAFVIMAIFAGIGWAFSIVILPMQMPGFKGEPTIADLLDHIQTEFSGFWDAVFADMVDGLQEFRTASTVFTVACILVILYSCCFCCCRPYGTGVPCCEHGVPDNVYCKECEEPGQASA